METVSTLLGNYNTYSTAKVSAVTAEPLTPLNYSPLQPLDQLKARSGPVSLIPPTAFSFADSGLYSLNEVSRALSRNDSDRLRQFGINPDGQSMVSTLIMANGSATGDTLAVEAKKVATRRDTTGWCFAGVGDAVDNIMKDFLHGRSAYMAADQLAKHQGFTEINVTSENLKKLPAGAIVVWGKTAQSPHGHISIALGNGYEASDHIQKQMTSLRGHKNHRVFIPLGS